MFSWGSNCRNFNDLKCLHNLFIKLTQLTMFWPVMYSYCLLFYAIQMMCNLASPKPLFKEYRQSFGNTVMLLLTCSSGELNRAEHFSLNDFSMHAAMKEGCVWGMWSDSALITLVNKQPSGIKAQHTTDLNLEPQIILVLLTYSQIICLFSSCVHLYLVKYSLAFSTTK